MGQHEADIPVNGAAALEREVGRFTVLPGRRLAVASRRRGVEHRGRLVERQGEEEWPTVRVVLETAERQCTPPPLIS